MYKYIAAVTVLLAVGLALIGCTGQQQHFITGFGVGSNVQRLLISSENVYELDIQREVSAKLAEAFNSGKYNVVGVETSYRYGYFGNYLGSAEIYHDVSGPGDGNHMRFRFVSSPAYSWKVRREEVQNRLREIENNGIYSNIVSVQKSISSNGSPAEVYYRSK